MEEETARRETFERDFDAPLLNAASTSAVDSSCSPRKIRSGGATAAAAPRHPRLLPHRVPAAASPAELLLSSRLLQRAQRRLWT